MPDTPAPLVFDTSFAPETGRPIEVLEGVVRVTASNSGPYTFTGTNSFILGRESVAVLDPGPADDRHRAALLAAIGGRKVDAVLLTHTHKDHSALAAALSDEIGAPLWFGGPHRLSRPLRPLEVNPLAGDCDWGLTPDRTLADGETVTAGGMALTAIATPGHCANHMAFAIGGTDWMLSGDHVMGWNSTLVAVPDGSMAQYLDSLRKVIALPHAHYLPAHGGPIADGPGYARALLGHRELRNRQVVGAVSGGVSRLSELLDRIYPTLPLKLRLAAAMTLKAHVEYLEARGTIRVGRGLFGLRLSPV